MIPFYYFLIFLWESSTHSQHGALLPLTSRVEQSNHLPCFFFPLLHHYNEKLNYR